MRKISYTFVNRTYAQIVAAYVALKNRYKNATVSYSSKLVNGLYQGVFNIIRVSKKLRYQ